MNSLPGDKLKPNAKREALAMFVHRWTHENAAQTYHGECPACHQSKLPDGTYGNGTLTREQWHKHHLPLISDAEWLARTDFAVTKDGDLDKRVHFCNTWPNS